MCHRVPLSRIWCWRNNKTRVRVEKEGGVNSQRKHRWKHCGFVVVADIKKRGLLIELLSPAPTGKIYDNFAMFSEEAARSVP
jgi:hypothetical protein